jgi:hypothetical protein
MFFHLPFSTGNLWFVVLNLLKVFENYLNILNDKDNNLTLSKFRTTNHKLPVENGRWKNIARENRHYMFYIFQPHKVSISLATYYTYIYKQ